ncbi:MAG: SHOCT domain-containing protein [Planctomycetota bacterium]
MIKFDCQGCGRTMSVPEQYAGKRVRCPACQTPQRVPMPEPSLDGDDDLFPTQPLADLSGLQDSMESGVRRLRQILIGCGECKSTIKVPEAKLGKTTSCPSCGVVLKVDAFNLAKAKGDLIDMTHLELEKADLLLDGGSHGSTLGGSSIQLDGSGSGGTGYQLNTPPAGSMSGVTMNTSQTQMRELRELNDLKHSGQITNEEYRERKKEIYAGKTLAIQAMSRSADGTGGRPVIKRDDKPGLLPKPVMVLIVLLIVGGAGYAAYMAISGSPPSSSSAPTTASTSEPAVAPEAEANVDDEGADTLAMADTPEVVDAPAVEELVQDVPEDAVEPAVEAEPADALPVTMFEIEDNLGSIGLEQSAGVAEPPVEMVVKAWQTGWSDYANPCDSTRAISQACEVLQRISVRDDRALIGVAVGPPASNLDSPDYQGFRQKMHDILTQTAQNDGVFGDLNIRTSERTANLGTLEAHRLHVTSKSDRNVRAAILTGIQDGYCVSYWFAGAKTLYDEFLDTVGRAELGPK